MILRELDSGSHQILSTCRQGNSQNRSTKFAKSDYRKAASFLGDSVKMNPKEKKFSRAYNDLLNEMQARGHRRRSFRKVGYAITGIATLLLIVGTIGITLEPAPREFPPYDLHLHRVTVLIGPEPLRGNPIPLNVKTCFLQSL